MGTLINEISNDGYGSQIHLQLNSEAGINLHSLVEYILIEECGNKLKKFIEKELGEFQIIEHF